LALARASAVATMAVTARFLRDLGLLADDHFIFVSPFR
jgi:hypothetical protein